MAKRLYRFRWDCGRQGTVEGVFVADDRAVKKAIGREVYFGEILGKHSEIHGELEEKDLTVLTGDVDFMTKAAEFGLVPMGYNPLDYLGDE